MLNWLKLIIFLFRCKDVALRKEYVKLVDSVRESGGDVKIFSSLHISGERKYMSFMNATIVFYVEDSIPGPGIPRLIWSPKILGFNLINPGIFEINKIVK